MANYLGNTPGFGVGSVFVYSLAGGASSVSGVDANGRTLTYPVGGFMLVSLNGSILRPTSEYTATTGTSISFVGWTASASDELIVYAFGAWSASDALKPSSNLSDVLSVAQARINLGLVIGTHVQAFDPDLLAIANAGSATDKIAYYNGSASAALADFTAAARTLLAAANAAAQRSALGLAIGADVQAFDAELAALAGLTFVQGDLIYRDATGLTRLGAGSAGQVLKSGGAGANPSWGAAGGPSIANATLSSTGVLWTGLPAGVKRFTVSATAVNGSSAALKDLIRIGPSGGVATANYRNYIFNSYSTTNFANSSSGSDDSAVFADDALGNQLRTFFMTFTLLNPSTNVWSYFGMIGGVRTTGPTVYCTGVTTGAITLSGALERVQIVSSTATYTAGDASLVYD
jgi:hypothetical protein